MKSTAQNTILIYFYKSFLTMWKQLDPVISQAICRKSHTFNVWILLAIFQMLCLCPTG